MKEIKITVSEETAGRLVFLDEHYFFGLYEPISYSEEEEYRIRDAVTDIAKAIREELEYQTEKEVKK